MVIIVYETWNTLIGAVATNGGAAGAGGSGGNAGGDGYEFDIQLPAGT